MMLAVSAAAGRQIRTALHRYRSERGNKRQSEECQQQNGNGLMQWLDSNTIQCRRAIGNNSASPNSVIGLVRSVIISALFNL
jgi:hypothetical protein